MKLRAKRGSYGDKGYVRRGQIIDVTNEKMAKQLVARGLYEIAGAAKKPEPPKKTAAGKDKE